MSWIDRIQNDLVIRTGDGKEYTPLWDKATKQKEYNVSEFEFANVPGTLVDRREPKGRKYGLNFYFQGEDNIEQSNAFEESADDKRPWVLIHPLYDRLVVQPLSMNIDDTKLNVTEYSVTVVETIEQDNPRTTQDPTAKVIADQANVSDALAGAYAEGVTPDSTDINDLSDSNTELFNLGKKIAITNEDFETYFNAFNTANSFINDATNEPLQAIRALQAVISAPAIFANTVRSRANTIIDQIARLSQSVSTITKRSEKVLFENNVGGLVSSLTLALVTNTDYSSRVEVFDYVDILGEVYDEYISNLDFLQSDSNNSPDSYIPSYEPQLLLNDLVNFTMSRLFEIAVDSRQERTVILEDDSNIILLSHRFYGLKSDDSTIDELVNANEIGINQLLQIKKGTSIKYYVT